MLTVSSTIDPATLQSLMANGALVVFEDSCCTVSLENGGIIGDSPYGYVDFMMPPNRSAFEALVMWARSWTQFSPNVAFY
jgi:hypothetical protein